MLNEGKLNEGGQRILVVVEGERSEPTLIEKCFELLNQDVDYEIVPYRTNLYQLIRYIDDCYDGDFEAMDIRSVLLDRRPEDGEKLKGRFTDVILVFDYDPQDPEFNQERLERAVLYFGSSDDLGRGKLYLNYPSVEALRDFTAFGEWEYYESAVRNEDLPNHGYKRVLESRRPRTRFSDFRNITGPDLAEIIAMNTGKIQHLVDGVNIECTVSWTRRPRLSEECCNLDLTGFLKLQGEVHDRRGTVYICGTCLFFVCENWPSAVDGMWHGARS